MTNGTNGSTKITAEEIFNALIFFLIKNPKKALIVIMSTALIVFGCIYLTFMKAQNDMMLDAMSAFKDVMQMEKTITDLKKRAEVTSMDLEERIKRLDEAEKRFLAKRDEIMRLRAEQDKLLKEIQEKLLYAEKKIGEIEDKQQETKIVLREVEKTQRSQQSQMLTPNAPSLLKID
jgi:septal ring factor EnvC (AmiA/AmiB activator)